MIAALVLPPVPLLLVLVGARLLLARRGLGWLLILLATVGLWLGACTGIGALLGRVLTKPPPALTSAQVAQLRADAKARRGHHRHRRARRRARHLAPEYGTADLRPRSLERLRYGLWLAARPACRSPSAAASAGARPSARPRPTSPSGRRRASSASR